MKSVLSLVTAVVCLPVLSAVAAKSNMACCASNALMPPAKFAQAVAMTDMMEIKAGQVALVNSNSKAVKAFGQRMITDHTKINANLTAIAAAQGITLPTKLDAQHMAMLKKISMFHGANFDRAYIPAMVAGHTKAVALFKAEAAGCTNAALKQFAVKTEPIIATHLKLAQKVQAGMNK